MNSGILFAPWVQIALYLLATATLLPVFVLLVQVLMALQPCRPREMPTGRRPSLAVVVPAHNEEEMIAGTLRAIAPQLVAGDRLIVVADNCSDATAAIATAAGATVIERVDQSHRGKGYALDFGVRHLERNPPEAVLIIDADCEIAPGAMDRLARLCLQSGRPVQALYLMRTPETVGIKTRVAEFAWLVKNHVRALGSHRLGIPCRLTGTGMAFPWSQIATAALASGHIVEDLKLGAHLARNGTPPLFCPEAVVMSYFPLTADGVVSQRVRWEHGHLGFILRDVPQLFLQAVRDRDCRLFALALDLSVPPLSLLSLLVLASIAGSLMFFAATASALPLLLTTASLAMLCVAVLLSWHRYGRGTISLTGLVYAPAYAFLKLPLYLKFLVRRQVEWVRSRRRGD